MEKVKFALLHYGNCFSELQYVEKELALKDLEIVNIKTINAKVISKENFNEIITRLKRYVKGENITTTIYIDNKGLNDIEGYYASKLIAGDRTIIGIDSLDKVYSKRSNYRSLLKNAKEKNESNILSFCEQTKISSDLFVSTLKSRMEDYKALMIQYYKLMSSNNLSDEEYNKLVEMIPTLKTMFYPEVKIYKKDLFNGAKKR